MFDRLNIQERLALVLWGSVLIAFIAAGVGLLTYQALTQEDRAFQIMQPYAQLVSVGSDAAVAFQDPKRAQEILDTLQANREILTATLYLEDGRMLAGFSRQAGAVDAPWASRADGVYLDAHQAELLQTLPSGAHLRLVMGLARLNDQTRQLYYVFSVGALILLIATIGQLAILQRMIVRPIAALTKAAGYVRTHADYEHRVPVAGDDEVSRLGQSFNAMLEAVEESQDRLLEAQRIAHVGNWRHNLMTEEILWSDEIFRILGCKPYPPTDEMGLAWVHPEDRPLLLHAMETPPNDRGEHTMELRIVRQDGTVRWVNHRWERVFDANGREVERIGTYQDITERKLAEEALRRLNRELRAISECNQVLVRAEDERSLVESICRIVCDEAGYRMAWVGYAEQDEGGSVVPFSWAGYETGYLQNRHFCWLDTDNGRGPIRAAIRSGMIDGIDDFESDPRVSSWRDEALKRGYRSCIALPLKDEGGNPFGVLCIYASEPHAFTIEEKRMLDELAGDLGYGIVTLRTREERNRAEEQIRIAATAFEAQEGILITDVNQTILRVNRAFTEITGYLGEEVMGASPRLLKSTLHEPEFYAAMWDQIRHEGAWQGEIWNRRKNGVDFPVWLNITAVTNSRNEVTHYVGTMTDITERKESEKRIEHLAFYDLLTDLPNRRLLMDRLSQAMMGSARSRRFGALLFIDLDNFKILNDTCGHDTGDQLLIEVARRLHTCVREGDTISRLGGDEFVIMLEDLNESSAEAAGQAKVVGEKVLERLNHPYTVTDRLHHSTPSIGITLFCGTDSSVDELLKQADIAMYQAKTAGRNTLRFYDPQMQADLAARADLESALRSAIIHNEFELHFQAQNDSRRGIIAAEALLRWRHPERGLVPPGEFISLAEETGLILSIGQWVLENACAQLARWSGDVRLQALDLAVNVSALQFRQKDFVQRVEQALAGSGAQAKRLKLELTESLVLDDIEYSIEKMRELKAIGVGFAMDDFGTGYSSLSYLTRLPLDQLKIDRSFIHNLPDNPNDAVVVQTIINLADSLGLKVIAEGVETEAQRGFLQDHGCPVFQGYLFSRPMDLAAFEALMSRGEGGGKSA